MSETRRPTAIVSGASTGIGLEIAKGMARAGYDLAVTARDAGRGLAQAVRAPEFAGARVFPISLDQRNETSIAEGFATAVQQLGSVDVLVNNAARALISLSSTHGRAAIAGRSVYGITKGALEQMTRMMAIEWAGAGIRVNAVAPTTVMTPSRAAALSDPTRRQQMLARIPMRRFPDASEIADAVLYLASPAAASITGHVLMIDGGLTAE